ncbi:hypothetical protein [Methylobacterium radiotolerans]|uniref:hypothetical protein n=1 Tax=Methylobacterium radiotolerans TaxID=31998 RepID=UPI000D5C368C|nr:MULTISPECIES: hypothetical protein [Methylobacterium]MDE3747366.1 hypothetical protein [Methylobacterium radiotolerans]PVY96984.1 hypothetical protein C7388_11662 [Methylobacterium organophilum]
MSRPAPQWRPRPPVASLTLAFQDASPVNAQTQRADTAPTSVVLDLLSVDGSYTAAATYPVKDLYSGTKTITQRLSLPQQVDAVPPEVLRNTAAARVARALDYVLGVGKILTRCYFCS